MIDPFKASYHCVKSVQIRKFFWSVFSCIRMEYGDLVSCEYKHLFQKHLGKRYHKFVIQLFFSLKLPERQQTYYLEQDKGP